MEVSAESDRSRRKAYSHSRGHRPLRCRLRRLREQGQPLGSIENPTYRSTERGGAFATCDSDRSQERQSFSPPHCVCTATCCNPIEPAAEPTSSTWMLTTAMG